MSDSGGDDGGDSGGGGKGGGGGGGSLSPDEGQYGPTTDMYSPTAPSSSPVSSYASSPGESAGFQGSGALPPEIVSGSSSGAASGIDLGGWNAPSLSDFVSGPSGGFNLAGSGPVGGDSGPIGVPGGVFSSGGNAVSLGAGDSNSLGTTAPSGGGGTSAMAFAAPAGVSGTPQLDSLVSDPNATGGSGGAPVDSSVFDSLNSAQTGAANAYADTASLAVPPADTTLPATSGSGSGTGKGGDSGAGNGISIPGVSMNNLGVATAGAGLLNNLINGNKSVPAMGQLNQQAASANATAADLLAKGNAQGDQFGKPALQSGQDQTARGAALQQFVATGTLPQGYEDQIQQSAQAAKSQIISNYANRGLPTDPTKNSSLAQELAQVDARLPAAREQLAQSLATTGNSIVGAGNQTSQTGNALTANQLITDGLQSSGISSQIYQTLASLENDQNKQRGAAIANFASALNGGTKGGVNINLGTAKAA